MIEYILHVANQVDYRTSWLQQRLGLLRGHRDMRYSCKTGLQRSKFSSWSIGCSSPSFRRWMKAASPPFESIEILFTAPWELESADQKSSRSANRPERSSDKIVCPLYWDPSFSFSPWDIEKYRHDFESLEGFCTYQPRVAFSIKIFQIKACGNKWNLQDKKTSTLRGRSSVDYDGLSQSDLTTAKICIIPLHFPAPKTRTTLYLDPVDAWSRC